MNVLVNFPEVGPSSGNVIVIVDYEGFSREMPVLWCFVFKPHQSPAHLKTKLDGVEVRMSCVTNLN
jgi:hypothetical protein